jgi:DeoR family fructose operon transcriptional repressor
MPLTAVTPGVNIATRLAERPTITSYLLGGRVRHLTLATSGSFAEAMLASFNADIAFIAAEGLSTRHGLSFSYETDAELARLMASHADRTVVLATARKLQQSDRITALPLSAIHVLVTDCTDESILAAMAGAGIEVLRAALPAPVPAAGPSDVATDRHWSNA